MSKREASLKAAFTAELKRQCPGYYMLEYATAGAPDRTIVGGGRQTNYEFKHATPDFVSPENQMLLCARLALASHCRYVFWWETSSGTGKRTMIVHPLKVLNRAGGGLEPEAWTEGFDQEWLVQYVKRMHTL